MKLKRIFGALAATAMAVSMVMSASAEKLSEVITPEDEGYYSIGGMGYFMSQEWQWNQGEWIGISEDGKMSLSYEVNEIFAGPIGSGTLGEIGLMICNLPADVTTYEVAVTKAVFTPKGGEAIELPSILNTYTIDTSKGDGRLYLRPVEEEDSETSLNHIATPEAAGWEVPGAFKGGLLEIEVSFNDEDLANRPEPPADEQEPVDEPTEDNGDNNADTGFGSIALAGLAVSVAGAVASKKRK